MGSFCNFTCALAHSTSGAPATATWNGVIYYYYTNLQGDIVGITDEAGVQVVTYTYDAWGKPLTTTGTLADTLGLYNPLRYRGYVYDTEIGLYYLQSRYYSPTLRRFISADVYLSTGQGLIGHNMFAYCLNNPVRRKDIGGATSVDIFDDGDSNLLDDDREISGGRMGNGGSGGIGKSVSGGQVSGNKVSGTNSSSSDAVSNGQSGYGKAPPQASPGTVYTQLSSDGKNTVISQTLYNEYKMPDWRIDYGGHSHGPISGVHIHLFSTYVGPNGIFLNKGPVVQCFI